MKTTIEHLEELRTRIITVIVFFLLTFILGIAISGQLLTILDKDIRSVPGITVIASTPLDVFLAKIKLGVLVGLILTFPVLLYELLKFARPGLLKKERKLLEKYLPATILLFLIGLVFNYFIFFKVALFFLARLGMDVGILNLWSISQILSFLLATSLAFGILFEIPLITRILSRIGILNKEFLKKQRKIIYVFAFILAALITPPDVITQVLIALPLIIIFEISLLLIRKS